MASIDFYGTINRDYVAINTMTFRLNDGRFVMLDRERTGYTIEEGKLDMTWRGCYYWDGDGAKFLTDEDVKDICNAELIVVDIDDDTLYEDPGYEVKIERWD